MYMYITHTITHYVTLPLCIHTYKCIYMHMLGHAEVSIHENLYIARVIISYISKLVVYKETIKLIITLYCIMYSPWAHVHVLYYIMYTH